MFVFLASAFTQAGPSLKVGYFLAPHIAVPLTSTSGAWALER